MPFRLALVETRGVELLRHPVLVAGNYGVSHVEDIGCRSVVAVERHVGIRLELHENLRIGTTPFVDCLIRIAHHEKIAVMACEALEQLPVVARTILHLIDHYIVELLGPVFAGVGEAVEDIDSEVYQVVVVEAILLQLELDVAYDRVGGFLRCSGQQMGRDVAGRVVALEGGYAREEALGSGLPAVNSELGHSLLGKLFAFVFINDCEALGIAYAVDLAPEKLNAEAMDRADEVVDVAAVSHGRNAPLHLLRRLVGEGHTEHVGRAHPDIVHEVSEPVGEHPGFA